MSRERRIYQPRLRLVDFCVVPGTYSVPPTPTPSPYYASQPIGRCHHYAIDLTACWTESLITYVLILLHHVSLPLESLH